MKKFLNLSMPSSVLSMIMHELQRVKVSDQISDRMRDLKTPMKWMMSLKRKKKKFKKECQDVTIYKEKKRKRT